MSTKTDKKKQREKEVKKKILARRTALRAKAKEEREEEKKKRDIQRATNKIEGKTICYRRKEEVINQLEHNLSILEALEQEKKLMDEQQNNATMINTLGVPIAPKEEQKSEKSVGGIGGSADVVFIPNTESNEEDK